MENEYFSFKNEERFEYAVQAPTQRVTNEFEIQPVVHTILAYLHGRNERMLRGKSGLQYQHTLQFSVRVMKYVPLAGHCYSELPILLAKKRSLINIQNNDEKCFGYCIVAHYLYNENARSGKPQSRNPNRPSLYRKNFKRFGLESINYPVDPKQVPEIEDKLGLRINLFSFFDEIGEARYPLYVSKKNFVDEVDLLYWPGHYVLIRNFNGFMGNNKKGEKTLYYCKNCFGHHNKKRTLQKHQLYCRSPLASNQVYILPVEGSPMKYAAIPISKYVRWWSMQIANPSPTIF